MTNYKASKIEPQQAEDFRASADSLAEWDEYAEQKSLLALASHPRCPVDFQQRLIDKGGKDILLALAQNPSLPARLLSYLLRQPNQFQDVYLAILQHPNLPQSHLNALRNAAAPAVRAVVAARSHQQAVLERLASDIDASVRQAASANPRLPTETRSLLRYLGFSENLLRLDPTDMLLDSQMLQRVYIEGPWMHWILASHPHLPRDIILLFLHDELPATRQLIAASTVLSRADVLFLAGDRNTQVRATVSRNPAFQAVASIVYKLGVNKNLLDVSTPDSPPDLSLSPEQFSDLLEAGPWLLERVARHPSLPLHHLMQLSCHASSLVRRGVAQNSECPAELLDLLALDPRSWVRRAVAQHPRTREDSRQALKNDPDDEVSETARQHYVLQDAQVPDASDVLSDRTPAEMARLLVYQVPEPWLRYLREHGGHLEDVNLALAPQAGLPPLQPGQLLVLVRALPGQSACIVGGGMVVGELQLTADQCWNVFGQSNLASTPDEWLQQLEEALGEPCHSNTPVRSVVLGQVFVLPDEEHLTWPSNLEGALEEASLLQQVTDRLSASQGSAVLETVRFGKAQVVHPRLGQSMFRAMTIQAYGGACCLTGTRVSTVLEAAHIQPYASGGEHVLENGLLLRTDIHTLFDSGHLTINPDSFQVELSKGSVAANDPAYASLEGSILQPPKQCHLPGLQRNLWYHRHHVFHGSPR